MAFNGSGTFTRNNGTHTGSTVWAQDNAAGTKIVDTIHDTHDQDIATGLSNCITKDGQTTVTADLPMATFKHTGVGSGTARTHYTSIAQLQDGGPLYAGTAGGTSTAFTVTLSPAITAYVQGMQIRFLANVANTGVTTLAVNELTALQINRNSSTVAIAAGEIAAGEMVTVVYETTGSDHFRMIKDAAGDILPLVDGTTSLGNSTRTWNELLVKTIRARTANDIVIKDNSSNELWTFTTATGNLTQGSSSGGSIVLSRDYRAYAHSVAAAVSAAGSTAADATQLTKLVNVVTVVTAGQGVCLSDTYPVGAIVYVINADAADTVKVYPKTSGGTIDGAASVNYAAGVKGSFCQVSAGTWYSVSRA